MNKFIIFISLTIIWTIALIDVRTIINDNIATSRTPSQIEIKPPLNREEVKPQSTNYTEKNKYVPNELRERSKDNLQNDIEKMNDVNKKRKSN